MERVFRLSCDTKPSYFSFLFATIKHYPGRSLIDIMLPGSGTNALNYPNHRFCIKFAIILEILVESIFFRERKIPTDHVQIGCLRLGTILYFTQVRIMQFRHQAGQNTLDRPGPFHIRVVVIPLNNRQQIKNSDIQNFNLNGMNERNLWSQAPLICTCNDKLLIDLPAGVCTKVY